MYWTMLRRELLGRKKHTLIVAVGLAVAVALVVVVSSLTAGVRDAQAESLESVYGVGTDLTVTAAPSGPGEGGMGGPGGPRFDFAEGEGETADGVTAFASSQLSVAMGSSSFESSVLDTVARVSGVAEATGTLALSNVSFSGEMPDMSQLQSGGAPGEGGMGQGPGGPDGLGGSSFGIDSMTVLGVDPAAASGPWSAVSLSDGRTLDQDDAANAALVGVLDESYATTQELEVGDTVVVGDSEVEIVGVVAATGSEASAAANLFLPLATAQELAGLADQITTVSITAASVDSIATVQAALESELPEYTISSQEELAATLSSSLSSTTSLITNLGTWLSIIVLVVSVALAVLLTSSGVTRRTREFGTLKAIGWSNRRVMSQIAGESGAQALLGGIAGVVIGLIAVVSINLISPTIGGGESEAGRPEMGGMGGMGAESAGAAGNAGGMTPPDMGSVPGGFGMGGASSASLGEITLNAPVNVWIVLSALALSLVGGLIAALFGAWRVSRLSPAEALRAVA